MDDKKEYDIGMKRVVYGDYKLRYIFEATDKHKLNLQYSFGIGDSETDICFLEEVEHPFVVKPTTRLRTVAMRNEWPIIDNYDDIVKAVRTGLGIGGKAGLSEQANTF